MPTLEEPVNRGLQITCNTFDLETGNIKPNPIIITSWAGRTALGLANCLTQYPVMFTAFTTLAVICYNKVDKFDVSKVG